MAAGKQPQSRFVALDTRPVDPEHWFAKMMVGGADHAQINVALSDVACYYPQTGALVSLAAFPKEPSLAERKLRDDVGGLYEECVRLGKLLTLAGIRSTWLGCYGRRSIGWGERSGELSDWIQSMTGARSNSILQINLRDGSAATVTTWDCPMTSRIQV